MEWHVFPFLLSSWCLATPPKNLNQFLQHSYGSYDFHNLFPSVFLSILLTQLIFWYTINNLYQRNIANSLPYLGKKKMMEKTSHTPLVSSLSFFLSTHSCLSLSLSLSLVFFFFFPTGLFGVPGRREDDATLKCFSSCGVFALWSPNCS